MLAFRQRSAQAGPSLIALGMPSRAVVAVFVATCLVYMLFPSVWGWNENSRLSRVMAVVDEGTLSIDNYYQRAGTETGDSSVRDGHVYSDKAIGTAVLGIPVYALAKPLLARFSDDPVRYASFVRTLVTWGAVSIPAALAVAALFALVWRATGNATTAAWVAAAGAFGTPHWPFATMLFGHATAGALLMIAFYLTRVLRDGTGRPLATSAGVGVALGLAVITEYPPALIAVLIGGYFVAALATTTMRRSRWACFGTAFAAGAVPVGLLLAYNTVCFGSPLTLSYALIAAPEFAAVHAQGMLGITMPDARRLLYLTVHPARGLFVQSPILLAGLAGMVPMLRRPGWRLEASVIGLALVGMRLVDAGFGVWWGGWSFAPRHLVPWVLLGCLPIAFLSSRWRPVVAGLLAISIVHMALPTLTDPKTPDDTLAALVRAGDGLPWRGSSPIWGESLALVSQAALRPSLGTRAGLPAGGFAAALAVVVTAAFVRAGRHRVR
jgi:hypothetical protein